MSTCHYPLMYIAWVFNSSSLWHCLSVQSIVHVFPSGILPCSLSLPAVSKPMCCFQFPQTIQSWIFFNSGSIIFAQTSLQRFYSQMLSICKTQDCLPSFDIVKYISSKWRNNFMAAAVRAHLSQVHSKVGQWWPKL